MSEVSLCVCVPSLASSLMYSCTLLTRSGSGKKQET